VFEQEATGTRCKYCGAGLMVMGGRSSWLNFLIKPTISIRETGHEITRIAIKSGWKPTHLRSVIPFYFPFYRTTGHGIKWIKGERTSDQGRLSENVEELKTRHVDFSRASHIDLSPGLFSPGYRAQSMHLYLATRENAGKIPFAPVQVDRSAYVDDIEGVFYEGFSDADLRIFEEKGFRIWERHNVLFFPMYLVEVKEGARLRLLLLDAVSGSLIRQLDNNEMEKLLENLGLRESRSPGETRLKLLPLICPECGGDLDPDTNAHLRFCLRCHKGWVEKGTRLVDKKCLWAGNEMQARDKRTVFLPFWSRESGQRRSFIPAFGVRSPRLLYNLSSRYYEADFPTEEIPYDSRLRIKAVSVRLPLEEADEMLDVIAQTSTREPFPVRNSKETIVLIPFRKQGPDLVDQFHGLAVPMATFGGSYEDL